MPSHTQGSQACQHHSRPEIVVQAATQQLCVATWPVLRLLPQLTCPCCVPAGGPRICPATCCVACRRHARTCSHPATGPASAQHAQDTRPHAPKQRHPERLHRCTQRSCCAASDAGQTGDTLSGPGALSPPEPTLPRHTAPCYALGCGPCCARGRPCSTQHAQQPPCTTTSTSLVAPQQHTPSCAWCSVLCNVWRVEACCAGT